MMLRLTPVNAAWARVEFEPDDDRSHVEQQLDDFLSFDSPGAAFSPAFKRGHWDGKIRLFKRQWGLIPAGLHDRVEAWAKTQSISCQNGVRATNPVNLDQIHVFLSKANLEAKIGGKAHDYQLRAFILGLQNRKGVFISPTGSGKSLIFWLWAQYYRQHLANHSAKMAGKILVVVPTLGLKTQLSKDFLSYGSKKSEIQIIKDVDEDVDPRASIVFANWQSIYKHKAEWFEPFAMVLGDEVHLYQSKSIKEIMEKLVNAEYRLGLTGTLEDAKCHRLILEGHFGPIRQVEKTANLQKRGILSGIDVRQLFLTYPESDRHTLYNQKRQIELDIRNARRKEKATVLVLPQRPDDDDSDEEESDFLSPYQAEVQFTNLHPKRMSFTAQLAARQPKHENTLVMFNYKERHGIPLYEEIVALVRDSRPVYYVDGDVPADEREQIRVDTERQQGVIIVASYGVFSTGINIKNLHRIIFAGASKSKYRVLQSVGRGLRLHATKDKLVVFDLVDDLRLHNEENYLYRHGTRRREFYDTERFPVTEFHIMLDTA